MHLSSIGYARMAEFLQGRITANERVKPALYGKELVKPQNVFALQSNRDWVFERSGFELQSLRQDFLDVITDMGVKNRARRLPSLIVGPAHMSLIATYYHEDMKSGLPLTRLFRGANSSCQACTLP